MPQIQYPGFTQPVRLPQPTIDQLGWRGWHPDQVRQGGRRPTNGQMLTACQSTGATVFAVQNWVVIGATKDIGHAYLPVNPQLFITRREYRGRGGGYQQWWTSGSEPENWALPAGMAGAAEVPDIANAYLLRTRRPTYPFWWSDLQAPTGAISTDWLIEWPSAVPTRARRATSLLTTDVEPLSPEGFPPTLEWSAETPDSPYQFIRRRLAPAATPSTFWVPELAAYAQWNVEYPDTTRRARLAPATLPFTWRPEALRELPATLLWSTAYPDTTRRLRLAVADTPWLAWVGDLAAEAQWSVKYPDTTRRVALTTAALASGAVRPDPVAVTIAPWWPVTAPDTTRRRLLTTAELPSVFRPEAQESYRPTLLWGVRAPETTRRAKLWEGLHPSVFRPEAQESYRPTLLWNAFYPPTTRRKSLDAAQFSHSGRGADATTFPPTLLWNAFYPPTTTRKALTTAELPTTFRPEDLQDFAAVLLWNAFYPPTTRRNTLHICRFPMIQYLPLLHGIIGEIIQRRPTDNPSSVGTRSVDARMGGL